MNLNRIKELDSELMEACTSKRAAEVKMSEYAHTLKVWGITQTHRVAVAPTTGLGARGGRNWGVWLVRHTK